MRRDRYMPHGALALSPKAFGMVFDLPEEDDDVDEVISGVAVISIHGPLMHQPSWFYDSYKAILRRLADALAQSPRLVVLSIDSPGGLCSGCFDTAREIRRMALDAGVPLVAHVAGQATSAAYAIASAAERIGISSTAAIGSIGVIDTLVDATGTNEKDGLRVRLITSGARKADGHPDQELTAEAIVVAQAHVDTLAEAFFELVVEHGRGESIDAVRGLEAAIFLGGNAVARGLADEIATLEQMIAFDALALSGAGAAEKGPDMDEMEEAIAALRKVAEEGEEEEAKRANAALKAMGEDDDSEPDAEDEDEPASEDEDEPAAEGDDEEEEASASALALKAMAEVHAMKAEMASEKAKVEREQLLASRPDFAPEMVRELRKADIKTVRSMCKTLPKGPPHKDRHAAAAAVTGTRGEKQGDPRASRLSPDAKANLDAKMGLHKTEKAVVHTPYRTSFGVRKPVQEKGN